MTATVCPVSTPRHRQELVFSTILFAVYLGVLMWVGLVLRRPDLLKVAGFTR